MTGRSARSDELWRISILKAFERCLESGLSCDEVSVMRICEEAHISKPTFYRYFKNKETMLCWLVRYALDFGITEIGRTCTWYEGFYRTSLMQYHHKPFFCCEKGASASAVVHRFSAQYQRKTLVHTITELHNTPLDDHLAFQVDSLLAIEGVMAKRWGESGMLAAPHVFAEQITSVVPRDLFELCNTLVQPNHTK